MLKLAILILPWLSPQPEQNCEGKLVAYFNKVSMISKPTADKVYHMDFTMTYTANPLRKDVESTEVSSKVYMTDKRYEFISNSLSVFQDESESFMVVHPQKQIIQTEPIAGDNSTQQMQQIFAMQQALVNNSEVLKCEQVKLNGLTYDKVILKANEDLVKSSKVATIEFLINQEDLLKSVKITYTKDSPYLAQTINYNKFSLDYKGWDSKKARANIFQKDGNVKSAYRGYRMIDNRN